MAWSIDRGTFDDVDLAGLKVVVVLTASDTLGFGGTLVVNPEPIKSVIIVDDQATPQQRDALVQFAAQYAQHAGEVVKVVSAPIEMSVDHFRHGRQAGGRRLCRDSDAETGHRRLRLLERKDVLPATVPGARSGAGVHG